MKKKMILSLKVLLIIVYLINVILLQKIILEVLVNDRTSQNIVDKYDYPDKIYIGEEFERVTLVFLFIMQLLGIFITLINKENFTKFIIIYFIFAILVVVFEPIKFTCIMGGEAGYDERDYYSLYSIKYEAGKNRFNR